MNETLIAVIAWAASVVSVALVLWNLPKWERWASRKISARLEKRRNGL